MSTRADTTYLDGPDPFSPPPPPLTVGPIDPDSPRDLALRAYATSHSMAVEDLDPSDADHPEIAVLVELFTDVIAMARATAFDEGVRGCSDDDHGQHRESTGAYNPYPQLLLRTRALRLEDAGLVHVVHRVLDPADRYDDGGAGIVVRGHGHDVEQVRDLASFHSVYGLPYDDAEAVREVHLVLDTDDSPPHGWSTYGAGTWREPREGETGEPVTLAAFTRRKPFVPSPPRGGRLRGPR